MITFLLLPSMLLITAYLNLRNFFNISQYTGNFVCNTLCSCVSSSAVQMQCACERHA
jgi:hypothetical protein